MKKLLEVIGVSSLVAAAVLGVGTVGANLYTTATGYQVLANAHMFSNVALIGVVGLIFAGGVCMASAADMK